MIWINVGIAIGMSVALYFVGRIRRRQLIKALYDKRQLRKDTTPTVTPTPVVAPTPEPAVTVPSVTTSDVWDWE